MNRKAAYWIEMCDYDLDTTQAMFDAGRYLYVGFLCHLIIEKALKAYWSNVLEEPPLKIHNLSKLAERTGLAQTMTDTQLAFIDTLEPLNIEARYPSYKDRLAKSLTPEYCQRLVQTTKELFQWIKDRL
ncbi:MAG: HEPN domain-containing protein [Bacteroidales bacterium]|nr:HEPN domain-containing protein [Bacteroidales bacterium]